MAKFKYYYDLMSQPSRALWIAFRLGKTPYEDCPVALRKLEHTKPEFKKVNRFQKVPCVVDGDFHLSESVAIIRYLSDKGLFSESLYPKQLQQRARVDEFLEWQHIGVRMVCSMYFIRMFLLPMSGLGHMPSEEQEAKLRKEMEKQLAIIEKIWLKDGNFVAGNELTIADIIGACEIEQTKLAKYNIGEKYPKISEWLQRVREGSNPYYDQAHAFVNKKADQNPSKL